MDRISIKITFITKEFVSIDFIENLLNRLDLRKNLNQSNWRAERFAVRKRDASVSTWKSETGQKDKGNLCGTESR